MHNKDFIDYYWDLITSHQFNADIYDEMFRDEWLALTKHFTTFQRLVTAVKNRHNRLKEKAYLEQLEKEVTNYLEDVYGYPDRHELLANVNYKETSN